MNSSPKIDFITGHKSYHAFGTFLENWAIFGSSYAGVLFLSPDAACTGAL